MTRGVPTDRHREAETDRRDAAIVRAVVALASEFDLRTIAEGVETAEVADALAALGVDRAQGYLYARPLPPDELSAWHAARIRSRVPAPRRARDATAPPRTR